MQSITATGIRGYLHWLIQDQPELAQVLIPQIAAKIPAAFSDTDQSTAMAGLRGLADDSTSLDLSLFPAGSNVSFGTTDFSSGLPTLPLSTVTSLASTANAGSVDPATTSAINNLVNSTLTALGVPSLTAQQYSGLTTQQLAQAQNGFPPTSATSAANGIGSVLSNLTTSLGGTTGVLIIGAVLLGAGLLLSSGGGSGSRARR